MAEDYPGVQTLTIDGRPINVLHDLDDLQLNSALCWIDVPQSVQRWTNTIQIARYDCYPGYQGGCMAADP
jgi:hypothetical protein